MNDLRILLDTYINFNTLSKLFNMFAHVSIITGMITLFIFISKLIRRPKNRVESVIRLLSALTGFLVYFGARVVGLSLPGLMMSSIAETFSVSIGIFSILLPSLSGVAVSWIFVRCIKSNIEVAPRLVILLGTFIFVLFSDVYAASYSLKYYSNNLNVGLLPNLTFTVGMSLYFILYYKPADEAVTETASN